MGNPLLERLRDRCYHVLLERKLKLTKPRRALLDYLLDHPGVKHQADDLFRELNAISRGIVSRATIYRTLELLADAGLLTATPVNGHNTLYELSSNGHNACHYQLVDVNTGNSVSFAADKELRSVLRRICREQGFSHQYHVLEVFGSFTKSRGPRKSQPKPAPLAAAAGASDGPKAQ